MNAISCGRWKYKIPDYILFISKNSITKIKVKPEDNFKLDFKNGQSYFNLYES